MKLTTTRGQIKEAVTGLGKIISGKCTLPVLGHVRVHADGRGATATGTDLEQVAQYRFSDAQVEGSGDFIVPLSALKPLTKGGAKDTIEINAETPDRITVVNSVGGTGGVLRSGRQSVTAPDRTGNSGREYPAGSRD